MLQFIPAIPSSLRNKIKHLSPHGCRQQCGRALFKPVTNLAGRIQGKCRAALEKRGRQSISFQTPKFEKSKQGSRPKKLKGN